MAETTDEASVADAAGSAERAVAVAMFAELHEAGEEDFAALPEAEQADFLGLAVVAMKAHADWLTENGFRIAPPGTALMPKTEQEAAAMLLAVQQFRLAMDRNVSRKTVLVGVPKLIVPPGVKLQ
jgi:hypothetical protein